MKQYTGTGLFGVLFLSALVSFPVSPLSAHPQDQTPVADSAAPFEISVDLNLVVLPVTVRDKKGGFDSNLAQQDFEVYEDGVRQSIRLFRHEDMPVTVGLVVDHSGSMHNKMDDVLSAARNFVQLSNPADQMFVVNFNEHVTMGLPAGVPFTNVPEDLALAIDKAPVAGRTALYDAVDVGLDRLKTGDRQKKVLIVISDGGDNASVLGMPRILKKAEESDAIIYTIGIYDQDDPDQNPGALRKLAKVTGGEAYFPQAFGELKGICEGIARDIRHQYTIGYVSGSAERGGRRTIRVVARDKGKDLMVRTRLSYLASADPEKTSPHDGGGR